MTGERTTHGDLRVRVRLLREPSTTQRVMFGKIVTTYVYLLAAGSVVEIGGVRVRLSTACEIKSAVPLGLRFGDKIA